LVKRGFISAFLFRKYVIVVTWSTSGR
jgi:hypothetical protein